jgi:hypothetical protein
MTVRIYTAQYEASHGRKPRQSRDYRTSRWAFQIDRDPTPVLIIAAYKEAVRQAQAMARHSVTVLP